MVEKFIQLKKRAARRALLYALLLGGSAATFVFGVLYATFGFLPSTCPWYGYLSACAAAFLTVGGVTLAFIYPTTKRFAKMLDEDYTLGEKVRTSIEFEGQSGAVLDLQRTQTQETLSALPKKKKSFGQVVKAFAFPVVAVAVLTTSLVLPKEEKKQPPYKEPIFQTSLYNVKDLQALIQNVQGSALSTEMIAVYDSVLLPLLALIQSDSPAHKDVIASVQSAMQAIMTATKEHNTYNAVVDGCTGNIELASLVKALQQSGIAYKSVEGANIYSFTTLRDKQQAILDVVLTTWQAYVSELSDKLRPMEETAYVTYVTTYLEQIDAMLAIEGVTTLPTTDGVLATVRWIKAGLSKSLERIADPSLGVSFAAAKADAILALEETYNINVEGNAVATLSEQAYTYMMKDYALQALSRIFGVNVPTDGEEILPDDGNGGSGSGGGGGNLEYPDDGVVLYPGNGQYEEYGKVLNEYGYYQDAMELIDANTEISEEMKQLLKEYFSNLLSKEN